MDNDNAPVGDTNQEYYLQIARLPNRKQQALVLMENGEEIALAYFKSDAVGNFIAKMIAFWVDEGGFGFEDLYISEEDRAIVARH